MTRERRAKIYRFFILFCFIVIIVHYLTLDIMTSIHFLLLLIVYNTTILNLEVYEDD